jgi:hypothetical protein
MLVISRECKWCGLPVLTKRSHTKLHAACGVPFYRWRCSALPGITTKEAMYYIEQQLSNNQHPNPKYKGDTQDEQTTSN